jgi:SAM-dependent methyltransferase
MNLSWRQLVERDGPVPPEAEALAGDIDLLVPIEPAWRALDLSSGFGARAAVLAHRCREVIAVAADPARLAVLEARAAEHPPGRLVPLMARDRLPLEPASFDLVVLEGESPWDLAQARALLRPGGWLVWLVEGVPQPALARGDLPTLGSTALKVARWATGRLRAPARWRERLEVAKLELGRIYIHPREYSWGYLPFDAPHVQRYYLESIQEEAQGEARGRARMARLTGRVGLYPYLVSAYVLVARAVDVPSGRSAVATLGSSDGEVLPSPGGDGPRSAARGGAS